MPFQQINARGGGHIDERAYLAIMLKHQRCVLQLSEIRRAIRDPSYILPESFVRYVSYTMDIETAPSGYPYVPRALRAKSRSKMLRNA